MQVWHPDRFEQQRRIREQAEEHLKQITAAYKQIESAGFPDGGPHRAPAAARRLCVCPWCGLQNRLPADYHSQEVSCGGCKRPFRPDGGEPMRTARQRNARQGKAGDSWTPSLVKCPSCAAPNWCPPEQMVACTTCGTFFSWN